MTAPRPRWVAAETSPASATATSTRLGATGPGLPIGRAVAGGQRLYSYYEDVSIDIWGPRTSKTTSRAIPVILAAPGTVIATSNNKRDLLDATRNPRAAHGPVWVFDPQGIANTQPTWWWNPLTYVTDETKARQLARLLHTAARDAGSKADAYFDPAGISLLANLLLAAACDGPRPRAGVPVAHRLHRRHPRRAA